MVKMQFCLIYKSSVTFLNTHLSRWVFPVVANKYNFHTNHEQFELTGSGLAVYYNFLADIFWGQNHAWKPQRLHVTVTPLPPPHPTTPPWKPLWQTTNISRSHCTLRHLPLPSPIYLQQRPTTLTDTFSVCLAPTILRSSSTQRKEAYHFRKRRWHETAHITQH